MCAAHSMEEYKVEGRVLLLSQDSDGSIIFVVAVFLPNCKEPFVCDIFLQYTPALLGNADFEHPLVIYPRKLSFADRTFPKASASESLAVTPQLARSSSLVSTRKKGLVCFSSPNKLGTVGLFSARRALTSFTRWTRAALPGSTVRANLALEDVYSWALLERVCL